MSERTYEQMRADAYKQYGEIRADNGEPGEHFFRVTPYERCVLFDRPPPLLSEMNFDRTTFFGMRIVEVRPQ